MQSQLLRIKKLTGPNVMRVASKHNFREIQAELGAGPDSHIDIARTHLNVILRGPDSSANVSALVQALLKNAAIHRLRRDAVRGVEIIFSLSPDTAIEQIQFFTDAVQWTTEYFAAPVVSAVIHNDEHAPHCHVIILPLIEGRMVGSDMVGGPGKLKAMHLAFHEQVGQKYGLHRPTRQSEMSRVAYGKRLSACLDAIGTSSAIVGDPAVRRALHHLMMSSRDPAALLSLMTALGINPASTSSEPPSTTKKWIEVMTRPVKREKPIGFAGSSLARIAQPYPVLGFESSTASTYASCGGDPGSEALMS